jgi:catalase
VPVEEHKVRLRADSFADHYSHARLFFRSQSQIEQAHLASALVFELSKVTLEHVRTRVMANLVNVDETLAQRVADGLAMNLPKASDAAVETADMEVSPALRIVGKYPETLKGRAVGILVSDGADGVLVEAVKAAVEGDGGTVKIVAPKIGGVKLKDGTMLKVDGQLAGTPSVLFDAVAIILSENGCAMLTKEGAAIDFAKDAFGHLKAIGYSAQAKPLLDKAGVEADDGVVQLDRDAATFLAPARTRQWAREPNVRILA